MAIIIPDSLKQKLEAAGLAIVPIEPTEEMVIAAHRSTAGWLGLPGHKSGLSQAYAKHARRYKAMVAAFQQQARET